MDEYQKLKHHNSMKQDSLNDLKKTFQILNNEEDLLREKIEYTHNDLKKLDDDFNKIIETYSHIVKTFIRAT
jgi:predicted  nucleic acid-binding Zn-ribbon protein